MEVTVEPRKSPPTASPPLTNKEAEAPKATKAHADGVLTIERATFGSSDDPDHAIDITKELRAKVSKNTLDCKVTRFGQPARVPGDRVRRAYVRYSVGGKVSGGSASCPEGKRLILP